ncbi:hypothetical protein BD413DRAFT_481632 [Trametes elegans]|nr:hypothetical protein BD413DRAFT_481632 [Trametes elegans]
MARGGALAWPANQSTRGHWVDPRWRWVPSPQASPAELDGGRRAGTEGESSRSSSTRSAVSTGRKQRTRRGPAGDEPADGPARPARPPSWLRLSCLLPKTLFSGRIVAVADEAEDGATAGQLDEGRPGATALARREISPAEWRAYGYWARPHIGRPWEITVNNATPPDVPRELSPPEVEVMFASLHEADGGTHPENWIPRARHPCLPPRPELWPTPPATYAPLPGELQLNPWLVHRAEGPPALHFDLRLRAADVQLNPAPAPGALHNHGERAPFHADGPNGAQPATHPGAPGLRITALAGDPQPAFWWPVTALAHHAALPVQVRDVLDALVANFEEFVTEGEWRRLSRERQRMALRAYARRVELVIGGRRCPRDDGLRRVDYLGDNICFRGLAPAPDGEGFMLFVGPPP